jgi:hypothetical protein
MPGRDDSDRLRDDATVVEEEVDVVLRCEEGADVALEHEVGLYGALDRLDDFGVGGVDQVAELLADALLPIGSRLM